jgi:hypothetical protein
VIKDREPAKSGQRRSAGITPAFTTNCLAGFNPGKTPHSGSAGETASPQGELIDGKRSVNYNHNIDLWIVFVGGELDSTGVKRQ